MIFRLYANYVHLRLLLLNKRLILCLALLLFNGFISSCLAAEFTVITREEYDLKRFPIPTPDSDVQKRFTITLKGEIKDGDSQILQAHIEKIREKEAVYVSESFGIALFLDSPGGEFGEGIRLAKIVRENGLVTVIKRDSKCLSACAVVFMAGYEFAPSQESPPQRARYVEYPAKLGFHRPFIAPLKGGISKDELMKLSEQDIADMLSSQLSDGYEEANNQIQQMLDVDFNAWPNSLLVKMLLKKKDDFVLLETVANALDWKISIINTKPRSPNIYGHLKSYYWLCANSIEEEWNNGLGIQELEESKNINEDKELGLDKNHLINGKPHWLSINQSTKKYYIMMQEMNGTGCELEVNKEDNTAIVDKRYFNSLKG